MFQQFLKKLNCNILCNQVDVQTDFNQAQEKLKEFLKKIQEVILEIDRLIGQRNQKAEKNINLSQLQRATAFSRQQLQQFFYLKQLKEQIQNEIIDPLNKQLINVEQMNQIWEKNKEALVINRMLKEAKEKFRPVRQKLDLIIRGQIKFSKQEAILSSRLDEQINIRKKIIQEAKKEQERYQILGQQFKKPEIQLNQQQNRQRPQDLPPKQIIQKPISFLEREYIKKNILDKAEIQVFHEMTKEDYIYSLYQFGVKFTPEQIQKRLYKLNHSFNEISDMKLFAQKLKWPNLCHLNLVECGIDDMMYGELIDAAKNFPELKILWLSQNSITNLNYARLYEFNKLEFVYFEENPINIEQTNGQRQILQMIEKENIARKRKLAIYY